MYLGKNIKHLRKEKGLNQSDFGEVLGVKKAQISSYEQETSFPRVEGLIKLSQLFDIMIDDLINKDLSVEEGRPAGKLPQSSDEEADYTQKLIQLLEKRVNLVEHELKKLNPDRAKELGIE